MDWKIIFIILLCLFIGFIAGAVRERVLVTEKFAMDFAKWIIAKNKEALEDRCTLNSISICTNEQLLEMFKLERSKTAVSGCPFTNY